jgi:MFS family permease
MRARSAPRRARRSARIALTPAPDPESTLNPPAQSHRRFAALHSRTFAALWIGLLVSNMGTWMQNVANGWVIYQLTNSPLWLGLLGLSFALPMTVLPLFSGAVVDRTHRIRLLWITQTGMMLVAFALAALTWFGMINPLEILAGSFASAALLAFDNPARQALIPELVPRNDLLNALSLNSATYNGAALVGPAIAGLLYARFGAAVLYFVNGVSFLAVMWALVIIRHVSARSGGTNASFRDSVGAGLAFAWRNRLVAVLLGLSAMAAIFGRGYQGLLPIFARDIWHGGPVAYSALLAAGGAGAFVGAFALAAVRVVHRQSAIMIGSGAVFAASIMAFALAPWLWLGIALMFVAGVSSTVLGTLIGTFIQIEAPNELRGRVMSLYTITLIGLPALGALVVGALAEALGGANAAPLAVLIGAAIFAVLVAVSAPPIVRAHIEALETAGAGPGGGAVVGGGAGASGWTREKSAEELVAAADPEELVELCDVGEPETVERAATPPDR